jgi:hypothetical protein
MLVIKIKQNKSLLEGDIFEKRENFD